MLLFRVLASVLLAQATHALAPVAQTAKGQKVYTAPIGSRLQQSGRDIELFAPDGAHLHTFANVVPRETQPKRQIFSVTELVGQLNETATNTLESFTSTFVVPPEPEVFDSQIIFMSANMRFIDPATGLTYATVRPTLQYGGSWIQGGSFYSYALQVEFAQQALIQFVGFENVTLEVGQTLDSTIVRNHEVEKQTPGYFWYKTSFPSLSNIAVIDMGLQITPSLVTLQLEEEGVFQPSHYPAGALVFEHINVNMTNGPPEMSWQPNLDPATQVEFKVDVDGAKEGKVEMVFSRT
ncbi:hypothetical protein MIND_00532500 [Mycena indigotica]|uniref:Glycoside hydrolase 131 catalytic N-terminal domain-containing protein n=1 Tax=Mycena indigotica TaxID=2126181 RepID=A0A8H6SXX1_9AGAR|nr:uncharacterized protein MIND_00532500 [Mycena indigotica]KAF7307384.1 hypothetical protein MIND_00532500 [Mycena indigotica]